MGKIDDYSEEEKLFHQIAPRAFVLECELCGDIETMTDYSEMIEMQWSMHESELAEENNGFFFLCPDCNVDIPEKEEDFDISEEIEVEEIPQNRGNIRDVLPLLNDEPMFNIEGLSDE